MSKKDDNYALINGERFETVLDKKGVQRFPVNRVVNHLLGVAHLGNKCDLNQIALMHSNDMFTDEEMLEFYRLMGYSVCGYTEVWSDRGVDIWSPMWGKDPCDHECSYDEEEGYMICSGCGWWYYEE